MNQGQEKFLNYILERVTEEDYDKAKALLEEGFEKQADGTFDMKFINEFSEKLFPMIAPEFLEEVKAIVSSDGPRHIPR